MTSKAERGMTPEEFYPGLENSAQFYFDLVDRHVRLMSEGVMYQDHAEQSFEARVDDIAERTKASMAMTSMELTYISCKYLLSLMEEAGSPSEEQEAALQDAIESIDATRRRIQAPEDQVWQSAQRLIAYNIGEAFIHLLKREDDGWLRLFLEMDPEFTNRIGGFPDWLQDSKVAD